MSDRNPLPLHLQQLERAVRMRALEAAEQACDLTAPAGGGVYSQGWIAAREQCRAAIRLLIDD